MLGREVKMEDRCLMCDEYIPEGLQVCPNCSGEYNLHEDLHPSNDEGLSKQRQAMWKYVLDEKK